MTEKLDRTYCSTIYYTIYQITNKITGERYIGQHKTKDLNDGYMGSGKIIKEKIAEFKPENFNKEILLFCNSQQEMDIAEEQMIALLKPEYNLHPGGSSFKFINQHRLHYSEKQKEERRARWSQGGVKALKKKFSEDPEFRKANREHLIRINKIMVEKYPEGVWKGRKHSEATRKKMSISKKGKQTTSTLGKHWYTNGKENIMAFECPKGWTKGRINKLAR